TSSQSSACAIACRSWCSHTRSGSSARLSPDPAPTRAILTRHKETSTMSKSRWTVIAASIAGVLLIAIAIVYFAEPAKSLPGFFPGHEAGSAHHHVKHGIAALLLGLGAFVLAWFESGPRTRVEA